MFNMYERSHNLNYYIPCAGEETILGALNFSINLSTSSMNPDGVLCVALEVAQGSTGCCCIVHCVHQQRASLRLVVNSNQVQNTLTGPFPRHSDTCAVCSDFSSHSRWDWYICAWHNHHRASAIKVHGPSKTIYFITSNKQLHWSAAQCRILTTILGFSLLTTTLM